jgi:hypothetical protein
LPDKGDGVEPAAGGPGPHPFFRRVGSHFRLVRYMANTTSAVPSLDRMGRQSDRLGEFVFAFGTGVFELILFYYHLVPHPYEVLPTAYFLIVGFAVGFAEWRAPGRVGYDPVS